ncbi:MAG: plastocyanin/azurin family copper-binding protein [Candidatus Altiarchaeia archaeon]
MDERFSVNGIFALAFLCLMITPCCVQNGAPPVNDTIVVEEVDVTEAQATTSTTAIATTTTKVTTTLPVTTSTSTTSLPVSAGRANVIIANRSFNPENITIVVGTIITWVNNDSSEHQIISDMGYAGKSGGFSRQIADLKSSRMYKGSTYSYRFQRVGNYTYHCNIYPQLEGSIQVLP